MDFLSLRPPLAQSYQHDTHDEVQTHDAMIRPVLSAILVGAHILDLSVETQYTACILLHRYYMAVMNAAPSSRRIKKEDDDDEMWIVASCLFLACKKEEESRRLRDVINCAYMISTAVPQQKEVSRSDRCNDSKNASNDVAPAAAAATQLQLQLQLQLTWNPDPPLLNEDYWRAKEKIVRTEQDLLRWIAFDVSVSHPHRCVVLIVNDLFKNQSKKLVFQESTPDHHLQIQTGLIHASWRILNDSVFHRAALQHDILPMACAAISLGTEEQVEICKSVQFKLAPTWWHDIVPQLIDDQDVNKAKESLQQATANLAVLAQQPQKS